MAQATLIIMGFSMAHNMWIDGMFQSMMMMHFETMFEIQQGFHHALNHYPSVHSWNGNHQFIHCKLLLPTKGWLVQLVLLSIYHGICFFPSKILTFLTKKLGLLLFWVQTWLILLIFRVKFCQIYNIKNGKKITHKGFVGQYYKQEDKTNVRNPIPSLVLQKLRCCTTLQRCSFCCFCLFHVQLSMAVISFLVPRFMCMCVTCLNFRICNKQATSNYYQILYC